MTERCHRLSSILVVSAALSAQGWPFSRKAADDKVVEITPQGAIAGSGIRFAAEKGISLASDAAQAMRDLKVASQESKESQASWSSWFSASAAELKEHDMVIDLEDLENITNPTYGWPMTVRNEVVLNKILNRSTLKVAVIGMYNRGKTYILSQLAGTNLEHGRLVHTVGLSVVLSKDGSIAFMDTAGENRAVQLVAKTEDKAELEIRRRVLGVQFLQEIVLEIADLVIVVVNQLTLEDQRYVAKVAKKLKSFKQEKQMIVVHNFKETMSKDDLAKLENQDIRDACGAVRHESDDGTKSVWWKTERFNALHVSMASSGSSAGNELNRKTVMWIRSTLNHRIPMLSQDVLGKSLMNRFVETTRKWLPIFFTGFTGEDLKDKFVLKVAQPKFFFYIGPDSVATLQEDLRVWDWEILNHFKVYELPYEVFHWHNETRVNVEIPGVFIDDPESRNVTAKKSMPDPFRARFAWTEQGHQVLNVSVRMASNKGNPPGLVIDAYRRQFAGDMPEPIQRRGTSVENKGRAQLKIDFTYTGGPEQFVEPTAQVHRNGLLVVTVKHAAGHDEDSWD